MSAAHRALQNPGIFTTSHYRQAGIAVLAGIAIRLVISIPVSSVNGLLRTGLILTESADHWYQSPSLGYLAILLSRFCYMG